MIVLIGCAACGSGDDDDVSSATAYSTATELSAAATSESVTTTDSAATTEVLDDATSTEPGASGDVELAVESGFSTGINSIGTRNTTAGAVISSPSADVAACEVQVTFSLQDAAGASVDTTTETVSGIPKSDQATEAPLQIGFDIPQEPTKLV